MKRVHLSAKPVRQVSENLHIFALPRCVSVHPNVLQPTLQEKELYQYIVLETLGPSDPRKKYDYVQVLKSSGLTSYDDLLTW